MLLRVTSNIAIRADSITDVFRNKQGHVEIEGAYHQRTFKYYVKESDLANQAREFFNLGPAPEETDAASA
jgi:hypothetical protein